MKRVKDWKERFKKSRRACTFSTLSEETLRMRFFRLIREITHEMLVRFCNIDYDREMVIVAEMRENHKRRIIGMGMIILDHDLKCAETAVLVHDAFQGKGLGYKFTKMLVDIAQEKGLEEVHGVTLTENDRALRLARSLGFSREIMPPGQTRITLRLK